MKLFSLLVAFLFSFLLSAQEVKYIPVFLDACDSITKLDRKSKYVSEFSIKEELEEPSPFYITSKREGVYYFKNDTALLPDTGLYVHRLYPINSRYLRNQKILLPLRINRYGIFNDTFYMPRFRLRVTDTIETNLNTIYYISKYMDCEELANGYHESYY